MNKFTKKLIKIWKKCLRFPPTRLLIFSPCEGNVRLPSGLTPLKPAPASFPDVTVLETIATFGERLRYPANCVPLDSALQCVGHDPPCAMNKRWFTGDTRPSHAVFSITPANPFSLLVIHGAPAHRQTKWCLGRIISFKCVTLFAQDGAQRLTNYLPIQQMLAVR